MSIDHITQICQSLKNSGKTPTTALVKAKVAPGTPLALIIKGIQQYKASQLEVETQSYQQTDGNNDNNTVSTGGSNTKEGLPSQVNGSIEQLTQLVRSQQQRIEQLEKHNQLMQIELKDIQKKVQDLSVE